MTYQPGFKENKSLRASRPGYHYRFLNQPQTNHLKEVKYIELALANGYKFGHSDNYYTHLVIGVDQNKFNTVE